MPKRRPSGDGMVRKRTTDGRWEGRIVVGHKENGLPIYQTVLASTQKELTSKLNSYRESFKGVNLTEDSRMSLGSWLDKWLDEHMAFTLRPSTLKGYLHIINDYIKPHLGGKQIYAVTTADVQKMYNALKKNGKLRVGADGEKGLSGSTVRSVHMVLHEAMEYALREHLIVRNPTESTTIPKASGAVMNILNDEQLDRFMEAIKQEPLWHDLFYTAITTGLRRGELCGLMWTDFDSDSGTLKIKRTLTADGTQLYVGDTKTVSGEREILLPSSTAELLKKRKEESRSKWIFPNFIKTEEPINPALAYSTLKRILKKARLPSIRFHDLRHTFATHAIASGVDAKTLSGILGHTNASFTLDRYTHVTTEMQRNAANIMDGVIENIIGEID